MASVGKAKHETNTTLGDHPELMPFLLDHIQESPARVELRNEIAKQEWSIMMGAPDEASLLAWLCELISAKQVVEFGVFRGSSTLAFAEVLPDDGRVVGFDISEEYVKLGKAAWEKAGLTKKIDLRIGDAKDTVKELIATDEGKFDLAFIDADKQGYDAYYEASLKLLRKGGIVAVDNTLWGGKVLNPKPDDLDTQALRNISEKIKADSRVSAVMVGIADGVYLARKL